MKTKIFIKAKFSFNDWIFIAVFVVNEKYTFRVKHTYNDCHPFEIYNEITNREYNNIIETEKEVNENTFPEMDVFGYYDVYSRFYSGIIEQIENILFV